MKKLLILGAGIYQVPLIKKAREMGIYTIVASIPGNYPGFAIADEIWEINTTDVEALLTAVSQKPIDGVCTTGTDIAMHAIGAICDRFQLSGLSEASAKILTDKARMKEAFLNTGVRTPLARKVFSLEEALQACEQFKTPVMIKAVDSSGSRGITKVTSLEEVRPAYEESMAVTRKDYVLVEEFVDGHEIGVDGFVVDGKLQLFLPHDKFVHSVAGTTIPAGHAFPYHSDNETLADLRLQMELVAKASGMNNCALNADVLIKDQKAYVLEAGGRAGATCIPELISIYCGFDYYEQMIRNALGLSVTFPESPKTPCMAKLLFSDKSGTISQIDKGGLSHLQEKGVMASFDYPVGDTVRAVKNGTDRIGQLIMRTDNEAELDLMIEMMKTYIRIY